MIIVLWLISYGLSVDQLLEIAQQQVLMMQVGNTFNLDTTIVTYTIIDTAGNSATCSFEVIIQDTISPTIICPNDTIVPTDLAVL